MNEAVEILTQEPTVFYSSSMDSIMKSMKAAEMRCLQCVSAGAADPGGWQHLIIKPILWRMHGEMYVDLLCMDAVVKAKG